MANFSEELNQGVGCCAFLDILGSTLNQSSIDKTALSQYLESLRMFQRSISSACDYLKASDQFDGHIQYKMISDSCFLFSIAPYVDVPDPVEEIKYLAKQLVTVSLVCSIVELELMSQSIFVRGGIAFGPLFENDTILAGPPVPRSVSLEKTVAKGCCIVLDNPSQIISSNVLAIDKKQSGGILTSRHLFVVRQDKRTIINPFAFASKLPVGANTSDTPTNDFGLYVSRSKDVIMEKLMAYELNDELYIKYTILRDLFNYSIEMGIIEEDARIPVQETDKQHRFSVPSAESAILTQPIHKYMSST